MESNKFEEQNDCPHKEKEGVYSLEVNQTSKIYKEMIKIVVDNIEKIENWRIIGINYIGDMRTHF